MEADRADLERKLEEMTAKYNGIKSELDSTIEGLENL